MDLKAHIDRGIQIYLRMKFRFIYVALCMCIQRMQDISSFWMQDSLECMLIIYCTLNYFHHRRRSRINEKLKVLQTLVPDSHKVFTHFLKDLLQIEENSHEHGLNFVVIIWICYVLLYHRLTRHQCWMRPLNIWSNSNWKYRYMFIFHV